MIYEILNKLKKHFPLHRIIISPTFKTHNLSEETVTWYVAIGDDIAEYFVGDQSTVEMLRFIDNVCHEKSQYTVDRLLNQDGIYIKERT